MKSLKNMRLEEKIKLDLKKSMMDKNHNRTTLLRTIIGEFNRVNKDISDDKATSILKKMKENAELFNNNEESIILSEYLPELLSENDTIKIIEEMFKENDYSIKDMGSIMRKLKEEYGQSMNMKIASMTVKKLID